VLPGTLNYVEGQASIGTRILDTKAIGSAELQPGQSLSTQNGRAEVLLTPGVFARLDDNSTVKMISPSLTDTELAVTQGRVMVEVDQIYKANDLRIAENGVTAKLEKTGLYDFDARHNQIRVFDGQARVRQGDRAIKLKGGHELNLNGGQIKAQKFKKNEYKGDLYRFSRLRSDYLAQASAKAARVYIANGWAYGPGWWWAPWFGGYTFLPADGILYSPFGWGFYSPAVIWGGPLGYPYRGFPYRAGVAPYQPPRMGPPPMRGNVGHVGALGGAHGFAGHSGFRG
jgi:hypothetical protein